jgi:uncharacterized membrane protein YgcG
MDPSAVDKPRSVGYGATITSLTLLFLISSSAQINFTFAQSQAADGQFPPTIIASTSTDTTPNSLKLLATQAEGAAVQEVSGFNLDILDNITAQPDSQLLVFVSDSSVGIVGAKASSASGQIIDLVPSTSQQATNSFSLANLPAGVYTLDVLTQKGNTRGAYEGILEIGQQEATTTAPPSPALPTEQSDSGENEDENGDEDNGDGDSRDEDSGDEDNEGTESGGDEGGGDEGGGDEGGGDEGGGDEGGGDEGGGGRP